ncbi:MAG: DUF4139 domain-containing protein [Acidobacteria bacterium]|nr:DUF4139 domain-containing protein [Acidobacteriota bacterium]MBI3421366.1 DUF4139 domain-containing protein [Acidobacteriota bacterium]
MNEETKVAEPAGQTAGQTASQTGASTIEDQKSVAITVYNSNLGLVKDTRTLRLPRGTSQLRFMDVAQQINATSVHIKSVTAPNALEVVEQSYEYDLLNPQKLLDKYVGKELTLVLKTLENNSEKLVPTNATLLSNNGGQVWQIGNQIVINPTNVAEIRFDRLPQDLIAKPTLVWTLNNTAAETHTVEASYLTTGLNWRSDYVLVVNQNDTKADLNGWVTLNNTSGTAYRNAELKLVAGDVNRVQEPLANLGGVRMEAMRAGAAPQPQFQEQAFFEYHLYTLQRQTNIKNNETKQISLLSSDNFNIKKELVVNGQAFYFQGYNNPGEPVKEKVGVYVGFKNAKENNLGMPLPAGVVRVYKADGTGAQQFVGEDRIDHTPKDETVRIKLGDAFDVVAERKQTDFKNIARRVFEYAYEIRIRNHKDEAVTVVVNEPIGGDWEMLSSTFPAEKTAAFAARFNVPVAKDGEAVLSYRVRVKF